MPMLSPARQPSDHGPALGERAAPPATSDYRQIRLPGRRSATLAITLGNKKPSASAGRTEGNDARDATAQHSEPRRSPCLDTSHGTERNQACQYTRTIGVCRRGVQAISLVGEGRCARPAFVATAELGLMARQGRHSDLPLHCQAEQAKIDQPAEDHERQEEESQRSVAEAFMPDRSLNFRPRSVPFFCG